MESANKYMTDNSEQYITNLVANSASATSIRLKWDIPDDSWKNVVNFRLYYQQVAKSYIQFTDFLPSEQREHIIRDLVTDTYYRVCLIVYRNDTVKPFRQCTDVPTSNWQIPVSIGSSIGAVLALTIIVLLVLIARCPSAKRKTRSITESAKYDSMSSHAQNENYEMSDTTMYGCHEDEVFTDGDQTLSDYGQSSVKSSVTVENGKSSSRSNSYKPHTHVLHVHATRAASNPIRSGPPTHPRHTSIKLDHTQCSRQYTL